MNTQSLKWIQLPKTTFPLQGKVAEGYGPVLKAFIDNFEQHDEIGASIALYHKGELVIDLWGGYANKASQDPWQKDTLVNVFSASKGVAALCLLMLADRGQLDYDKTVTHYWPEFAQNGKQNISVRQLLSHTSGLCAIDSKINAAFTLKELASEEGKKALKLALEKQAPLFKPGSDQAYNAVTFGMYAAELFHQVSGETMTDFYRREIQQPLQSDFWMGNADTQSARIASLYQMPMGKRVISMLIAFIKGGSTEANVVRALFKPGSLPKKAFTNPAIDSRGALAYSDSLTQQNAFWWGGGFSNARGLATLYAPLAQNGNHAGVTLVNSETLKPLQNITSWSEQDRVLGKALGWNQGFLKEEPHVFGRNPEGFGHSGLGGALGWADPIESLSFGYAMNALDHRIRSPRCMKLCQAIYASEAIYAR